MTLSRIDCCALLSGMLLLGACRAPSGDASMRPVTDDIGRHLEVPASIDRIVTVAPSVTELVYAAGAGHKLVGVTTADDYPPEIEALPRFDALPLDFEAILALEPDLAIASDQVNNPNDAATLTSLGVPVYFLAVRTLQGLPETIRRAGSLLATESAANRMADSLEVSMNVLRTVMAGASSRPTTLFLIGDEVLYAFGKGSYIHELIALAGGESLTASFSNRAPILSDEYVLLARPEVIVGAFGEDYDPARLLRIHPTWDLVPAVRHGRVYGLEGHLYVRPGPRLVEGAWRLAARLHPSLFQQAP